IGPHHQRFGIVRIECQHLPTDLSRLVGIVRALVRASGSFIQHNSQFAVWELGGKIVRGFLQGSRIVDADGRLKSVVFRLRLGLWRTLSLWLSRCALLGAALGTTLRRCRLRRRVLLTRGRILWGCLSCRVT